MQFHEVEWKTSIKYLDVQLDRRLSFGEHLQVATAKAIQCGASLARIMPNIGGPRKAKRSLVASVVHGALQNHAIQRRLFSTQTGVALRITSAYRTLSDECYLVLASVPPIDLLAKASQETFQLRKDLTCITDLQEIARAKTICKEGRQTRQEMADEMA